VKLPNVPNCITIFRVLMIPVLMVFLLVEIPGGDVVALVAFVVASMSDFVDGYLARRWHQTTILGAFLDPLADKLLVTAALVSLVELDKLSAWIAIVVIARELAVSGLRMVAAVENVVISASWWGKVKTSSQMFALAALIITPRLFKWEWTWGGHHVTWYFVVLMLVLTMVSGIDYFVKAWKSLQGRTGADGERVKAESEGG
jgi:CDP-diacylglycerol--glycerol-3-phosphate 3-phosphatidyltransferase